MTNDEGFNVQLMINARLTNSGTVQDGEVGVTTRMATEGAETAYPVMCSAFSAPSVAIL
jgi:hypothetical protein